MACELSKLWLLFILWGRVGLALAIALVSRWEVRQWQVPKAWARIFLGCRAVGIRREVFSFTESSPLILLFFFSCPTLFKERSLVHVQELCY
jgi:hypothetical protein